MKKVLNRVMLIIMSFLLMFSVFGCNNNSSVKMEEGKAIDVDNATQRTKDAIKYIADNNILENNKGYTEELVVRTARSSNPNQKFLPGDSYRSNPFTELYKSIYNIKLDFNFIADQSGYEQKLDQELGAQRRPDIFAVNGAQLKSLIDNNLIWDLTDTFEKYASKTAKRTVVADEFSLESAKKDGKLYAIPEGGSSLEISNMLYIRQDWLKTLGLELPKTIDDVISIAKAFKDNGFNGKPASDSLGLAVAGKDLYSWAGSLMGFFNAYGAYPSSWIEKDGKLVYGSTQPEVRKALEKLAELKEYGAIDSQYATKGPDELAADLTSGKFGMAFGHWWISNWPLQDTTASDPNADWIAVDLVGETANAKIRPLIKNPTKTYYVVSKNFKNPEALIKLLNVKWAIEDLGAINSEIVSDIANVNDYWQLPLVMTYDAGQNLNKYKEISDAIKNKDNGENIKNQNIKIGYDDMIKAYVKLGEERADHFQMFTPNGSYKLIYENYQKSKTDNTIFQKDLFYGSKTRTMISKGATLEDIEDEYFINSINTKSKTTQTEFNKFISNYNNLGGTDIQTEVNNWYNSIK